MNLSKYEKRELRRLFVQTQANKHVVRRSVTTTPSETRLTTLQALSRKGALAYDDFGCGLCGAPAWSCLLTDAGQVALHRELDAEAA
jgi:hypothetical protein